MPEVIGVRFKPCGKIYDFEVNGFDAHIGDLVVVESEFGPSIGNVIIGLHTIENPERELKKVIRKATQEDLQQREENANLKEEAREFCLERIMARGLPMKLVGTEVTLDRKRIIFYFTAEKRIDFRELVKDLAAKFKTRIEMRQIGVRDEAKMLGGLGVCGRELCCTKFLTTFEPISIKMAKRQELALNTGKLSGLCGRLMCCLGYEYEESSPEAIELREEETVAIEEETEELEMVVASSDLSGEVSEPEPPPPSTPVEQEHKEMPKHFTGHRRRRRRRKRHRK
ncbi:MAG: hypothetical protein FJ243_03445 [Nitrospira sp.]|nr:hypothetical protein [Nitrospira sp.]